MRFLIAAGGVLFFILLVAYFFWALEPKAASGGEKAVSFENGFFKVSKGEGLREIGARLSQKGLIKSIAVFKIYALLSGNAQKFQPGIYEVNAGLSIPQIVKVLTAVGQNEVTLTIPEGMTLKDIDTALSSAGVIEKSSLTGFPFDSLKGDYPFLSGVSSLEGFLFPDTYRFEVSSPVETAARKMLDNFKNKVWTELSAKPDWYDLLILASFLEREVVAFSDRQIVAGILLKRLKLGMPLQVDAALSYLKCNGEIKGCENAPVARKDLTLPSPYNTYQRLGWTPTPIANPGEAAVSAALNPAASSYLYYLSAKETGETIFAKTLEEHNRNRVKYL